MGSIARPGEFTGDGRSDGRDPYNGPFVSNEEARTTQALLAASMPRAEVQALVTPPIAAVEKFPDRYGYRTRQIEMGDLIDLDRAPSRRVDFSGTPSGYAGASRNSLGSV